jgi:hypothetical protein
MQSKVSHRIASALLRVAARRLVWRRRHALVATAGADRARALDAHDLWAIEITRALLRGRRLHAVTAAVARARHELLTFRARDRRAKDGRAARDRADTLRTAGVVALLEVLSVGALRHRAFDEAAVDLHGRLVACARFSSFAGATGDRQRRNPKSTDPRRTLRIHLDPPKHPKRGATSCLCTVDAPPLTGLTDGDR